MKIRYILTILLAFCLFSCKEDALELYHGDNFIHFTPNDDDKVGVEYNFATEGTTTETEVKVPVKVRLWGYLPEKDFNYIVSVVADGTTASAFDYELSEVQTYKAGLPEYEFLLTVRRSAELLDTDYSIILSIVNAEGHVPAPAKYLKSTVRVVDRLSGKAPAWWSTTPALGAYSDMKLRMFNLYLGKYLTSLDGYTAITLEAEVAAFKQWWKERWDEGKYRYYADEAKTIPLYDTIPD